MTGNQTPPKERPLADEQAFVSAAMALSGQESGSGERLFIGLVVAAAGLICLLLALLWLIPVMGFGGIHPWLPHITAVLLLLAMAGVAWASISLFWQVCKDGRFFGSRKIRGLSARLFLPLSELLGRALGFSTEQVRRSFITVNNELVLRGNPENTIPPEKILLLLPHCLQASVCPRRLTHNPDNCTRCGQCVQGGLLALRDTWGVHMAVATGGTIARRIVGELKPKLIIAVACERDLASGIQDTYPLPVYGVLNQRPHGPCLDTTLDLTLVEAVLRRFIKSSAACDGDHP